MPNSMQRRTNRKSTKGNALIELSLLLPWLIFLFTGTFDLGFYYYALESVQNAARTAAIHTSANSVTSTDQTAACSLAIGQLRALPNIGQSFATTCGGDPVTVTAGYCSGTGACGPLAASPDSSPAAYVTVTYRMPPLFRFPVQGLSTITRTAAMRLRDNTQ